MRHLPSTRPSTTGYAYSDRNEDLLVPIGGGFVDHYQRWRLPAEQTSSIEVVERVAERRTRYPARPRPARDDYVRPRDPILPGAAVFVLGLVAMFGIAALALAR